MAEEYATDIGRSFPKNPDRQATTLTFHPDLRSIHCTNEMVTLESVNSTSFIPTVDTRPRPEVVSKKSDIVLGRVVLFQYRTNAC